MSTKNLRGSKRLASYAVVLAALWALSGCSSSNGSTDTDGGSTDATTDVHVGTDSGGGKDSSVEAAPAEGGNTCMNGQTSCNGKCVTLSSDPTNCGTCGSTCGTGLVCSNGTCALSCGDGGALTQCGNGCYDLQTDSDNCGSCGTTCTGGQVCQTGKCQQSCGSGSTLCGAQCVNTQSDNLNCGGCGTTCAAGTVCSAGSCQLTCGGGLTHCSTDAGAVCKDLTSDGNNCGSCGNVCAGGTVCSASACVSSCGAGQIDCAGSCINPQTNPQYCGATGACGLGGAGTAGTTCATGQSCVAGACTIVCPPGQILCGGACVDPTSNNTYCGASGSACTGATPCTGGTLCTGGVCKTSCNPGQIVCNNTCVNPLTDLNYCGANTNCAGANAGTKCPVGDVCSGGTCQITCGIGLIPCGGKCVDPGTSLNYCGASGNCQGSDIGTDCTAAPYGKGYVCSATGCTLQCQAGYINCNNNCIDPGTNNQYCGANGACGNGGGSVGMKCASGTVCSGGSCNLTCLAGQAECTENGTLQCVNPKSDPNFCGAAGYSGTGNTTGQCNVKSPTSDPNYQGVACSTTYAVGSSCSTGNCACPNGSGGTPDVVCTVGTTNTCIDPLTNNSFCGANSACGGYTDCSTISGSSCVKGVCQCPLGSGGATDKEVVCSPGGAKTCVDPQTDNAYCGANSACGGYVDCGGIKGSNCTAGACTCPKVNGIQYIDCNLGGTAQSCIDPSTSASNCGAGGNCKSSTPTDPNYQGVTCGPLTQCGPIQPPATAPPSYTCNSTCTALQKQCNLDAGVPYCATIATDNNNCGGCGVKCGALQACANGICSTSCSAGQTACPAGSPPYPATPYCASLSSDNNNCGTGLGSPTPDGCGRACTGGNTCSNGVCGPSCSGGQTLCAAGTAPNPGSPYCASLHTDNNNCGTCNEVCPGGTTCDQGICVAPGVLLFTSCGATGHAGPGQPQCDGAYTGTSLAGVVTVSAGIQQWTVPTTGNYFVEAIGGQGASGNGSIAGGMGADISGTFALTKNTVLDVVVGQMGLGQGSNSNGGGGGGSFVVTSGGTILLIAGGGGGARVTAAFTQSASTTTSGLGGTSDCNGSGIGGCPGGSAGGGGGMCVSWGGGGAGYSGNGVPDSILSAGTAALSFTAGALGGSGGSCGFVAEGGFGGGGSGNGCDGGGGGGGYSGGAGGCIAGGGGSINNGTNQGAGVSSAGGNGTVRITFL